jgi:hypothetical protein
VGLIGADPTLGQPPFPQQAGFSLPVSRGADRERLRKLGIEGATIVAANCDDDGDAGFEGGDHAPVINQSLAAELRVATVLGAQQPIAATPQPCFRSSASNAA